MKEPEKIVEYNKKLETGEELIPQPLLVKNNWPSIPAVDFSELPSYLDKLEDLGVIKYAKNPISRRARIKDSKTGKGVMAECIVLTFIQYVNPETIKDYGTSGQKNFPISIHLVSQTLPASTGDIFFIIDGCWDMPIRFKVWDNGVETAIKKLHNIFLQDPHPIKWFHMIKKWLIISTMAY